MGSGEPRGEPDLQAHPVAIRSCSPLPVGVVSGEDPCHRPAAGKPSPCGVSGGHTGAIIRHPDPLLPAASTVLVGSLNSHPSLQ